MSLRLTVLEAADCGLCGLASFSLMQKYAHGGTLNFRLNLPLSAAGENLYAVWQPVTACPWEYIRSW